MSKLSTTKWLLSLALLASVIILVLGWLFLRQSQNKPQLAVKVEQDFQNIPLPPEVTPIHQKYYACPKCLYAGTMALYSTNLSWETVFAFYQDYGAQSQWECSAHWPGGVTCNWPFSTERNQEEQLNIVVNHDNSELWYSPVEASRAANAAGQTVYLVQIVYFQDKAVYERECPPDLRGACEDEWWQTESKLLSCKDR